MTAGGAEYVSCRSASFQECTSDASDLEVPGEYQGGEMPGRILMAGGPDLDEEELEEVSLRVQEEEEGAGLSKEEDGMTQVHPPSLCLSFVFCLFVLPFLFPLSSAVSGEEGGQRCPTLTARAGPG